MSIRNKIILYFSLLTIALTSAALWFIYTLFAQYRETQFQEKQKEKIETTLKFLTRIKEVDHDLLEALDSMSIHSISDERTLIFNKDKKLVYSSISDTPVSFSRELLNALSDKTPLVERKEGPYDVIGLYLKHEQNAYYGISKAHDVSGYSRLNYLKVVISFTLLAVSLLVIFLSYYLSKKITYSIDHISHQIKNFDFDSRTAKAIHTDAKDEIALLVQRFNELMKRMNEAFAFQKHAIQHISHELKTPIAVLVSNFERIEKETEISKIKDMVSVQKENTRSLSKIINALLEIAKTESGNTPAQTSLRIDELIFDLMEEFRTIHPDFQFSVKYAADNLNENQLTVKANDRLMKAALSNLMLNCIQYSTDNRAVITIASDNKLKVDFTNTGPILRDGEKQYLFQHFFRGENSKGKSGFGLGLVFIDKILKFYGGEVTYQNNGTDGNTFTVFLPLS